MELAPVLVADWVHRALREDLGDHGDVTSRICLPAACRCRATISAKASGVVAGLAFVQAAFLAQDADADVRLQVADGDRVVPGDTLCVIDADASAVLAAERTALNFLGRLSGIAAVTRAYADAVAGSGARIFDTRKTTPGMRELERYAVRVGGGHNHRFGLFDRILIKENHFAVGGRGYEPTVRRAVEADFGAGVVAEARDRDEAIGAVRGGAGVVMLDNFAPDERLAETVEAVRRASADRGQPIEVEVSGGIRLDNVAAFAACGVDRISVGALTHSAVALDCSLLVKEPA